MTAAVALSVSALIAACGAHSTNPSNETFTIYEDAPKMSLLDLGQPGNSPGDVYHFSAPLRSSAGGQITGEVFGSKTLIKLATDADPDVEKRGTLLFFTFGGGQDQIVVFGITNYSPTAGEFAAGPPHAECGWFVHASIHVTEVIGTEFKDAQNSAALTRLLF